MARRRIPLLSTTPARHTVTIGDVTLAGSDGDERVQVTNARDSLRHRYTTLSSALPASSTQRGEYAKAMKELGPPPTADELQEALNVLRDTRVP